MKLYMVDEEGEEYMSEGEDGTPCFKWRRKRTKNTAGEGGETVKKIKKAETGVEEKTEQKTLETQKQSC